MHPSLLSFNNVKRKQKKKSQKRARQGQEKILEKERLFKLILLTRAVRGWGGNLTSGENLCGEMNHLEKGSLIIQMKA